MTHLLPAACRLLRPPRAPGVTVGGQAADSPADLPPHTLAPSLLSRLQWPAIVPGDWWVALCGCVLCCVSFVGKGAGHRGGREFVLLC